MRQGGIYIKKINKNITYSEKRIIESLLDLMCIKKLNDITISEITENAEVARRTFYRHFNSKEDILNAYLDTLINKFINDVDKLGDEITCDMALRILFKICYDNKEFFHALALSDMSYFMFEKWNTVLPNIHKLFVNRIIKFPKTTNNKSLEYLLAFNVGGIYNIVIKWINEGLNITPDELANIVEDFFDKSLI